MDRAAPQISQAAAVPMPPLDPVSLAACTAVPEFRETDPIDGAESAIDLVTKPEFRPTIGTCAGQPVDIKLGRLLATKLLIQAASGGGKSWALRRILEQTYGVVQQIVIDPEGELVTLAEKYDYMVCAPDEGAEVRITRNSGAKVADAIYRSRRSAILSLGEFELEDMQQFVADFLTQLMRMPKELWGFLILAIDEAHLFAPQHDKAESKKPMIDVAGRGRKRGTCMICATLRLSQFHKGVAAHLENKLIGLTTLPVDIERAADQLGVRLGAAQTMLRNLEAGEFVAYGPALTYDLKTVRVGQVESRHGTLGQFDAVAPKPSMSRDELAMAIRAAVEAAEAAEAAGKPAKPGAAPPQAEYDGVSPRFQAIRPLLEQGVTGATVTRRAHLLDVGESTLWRWMQMYGQSGDPASLQLGRTPLKLIRRLRELGEIQPDDAPAPSKSVGQPRRRPARAQRTSLRRLKPSPWAAAALENPMIPGEYEAKSPSQPSQVLFWSGRAWYTDHGATLRATFGADAGDRWRGLARRFTQDGRGALVIRRDRRNGAFLVFEQIHPDA